MGKGLYEVLKDVEVNTKDVCEMKENLKQIASYLKTILEKLEVKN